MSKLRVRVKATSSRSHPSGLSVLRDYLRENELSAAREWFINDASAVLEDDIDSYVFVAVRRDMSSTVTGTYCGRQFTRTEELIDFSRDMLMRRIYGE